MADARDILTLAEAKRVLRIGAGDSSDDDVLPVYITAASRAMDQHFGYTVAMAVTNERHDGINRSGRGYRSVIVLRHRPVLAITSIVEYNGTAATTLTAESNTSQPSAAYLPDPYDPDPTLFNGHIRRRVSGYDDYYAFGRQNVVCTYTAGRVASTTNVDARFKRACGLVLENLWRDREPGIETQDPEGFTVPHQGFPAFAIPQAARMLLTEEWGQHQTFGIG